MRDKRTQQHQVSGGAHFSSDGFCIISHKDMKPEANVSAEQYFQEDSCPL